MTAHDPVLSSAAGMASRRASSLWCGVLLGPVFYGTFLAQALTRSGYEVTRHPLSLLSLGSAGWVQILNFIVAGLLAVGFSRGERRLLWGSPGGIWLPRLFLAFGLGMLIAGVFRPEPMLGFPPGSRDTLPTSMSVDAALHGVGFLVAFGALTAATFVFSARVARSSAWRIYSAGTGVLIPLLLVLGFASQRATSIAFIAVGIVAFAWVDFIAWSHLNGFTSRAPRSE